MTHKPRGLQAKPIAKVGPFSQIPGCHTGQGKSGRLSYPQDLECEDQLDRSTWQAALTRLGALDGVEGPRGRSLGFGWIPNRAWVFTKSLKEPPLLGWLGTSWISERVLVATRWLQERPWKNDETII